jgi:hypothetical protein
VIEMVFSLRKDALKLDIQSPAYSLSRVSRMGRELLRFSWRSIAHREQDWGLEQSMTIEQKLQKNIAGIGLELGGRAKTSPAIHGAGRNGRLSAVRFVLCAAKHFADAQRHIAFHYDWNEAVTGYVKRLIRLSKEDLLHRSLIYFAASDSIVAAERPSSPRVSRKRPLPRQ